MRTKALHRARWLQQTSAVVGVIAGIATAGFALTNVFFPSAEPSSPTRQTVTHTTPTTAPSTTTVTTATTVAADSHSSGVLATLGIVLASAAAAAAAAAGIAVYRRRVRSRVDRKIAEVGGGESVEAVAATVLEAEDVPDQEVELVHQRIRRHFIHEAALGVRELGFFEFLPSRPRSVKRAWNDFLLRAGLAIQRGLLTDGSTVRVEHLSKWIVLSHAWPTVARAVEEAPEVMDRLEGAPDVGRLEEVLDVVGARIAAPERLLRFVRLEPRLSPVFDDLTRLQLTPPAEL
jgi:hypothetical protein